VAEIEIAGTCGPEFISTEEAARRYPWIPRERFRVLAHDVPGMAKRPGKRKFVLSVAALAEEIERWDVVRQVRLPEITT
jgi:hypothetical protein